jgi:hypothetical protein
MQDYFSPQDEGLIPDQDYFDWLEEMYDPDGPQEEMFPQGLTWVYEGGTFLL